jgi:hypothetical protein
MDEKTAFKYFFVLFWVFVVVTAIGVILLLFYNDTLQKVSIALGITGLGMSLTWMCFSMCNNAKNELDSKIFKAEILTRLDSIENQTRK